MKKSLQEQAKELDALSHIERNGDLVWWEGSGYEAEKMFDKLIKQNKIKRNTWTGKWHVTKGGSDVNI